MAKTGSKTYNTAVERLNFFLKANRMRPTIVRKMVLEQVCALPQPFTAEQLTEACAAQRISVGSIYNTLELFVAAHILHVTKRQRGLAAMEYELITGSSLKMQIICQKCGRVSDIHDKALTRLIKERKYKNFNQRHISLVIYGECKICRTIIGKEEQA